MKETFGKKSASSKRVSEVALMGHGAFNSNKIRFNYIVNKEGEKS